MTTPRRLLALLLAFGLLGAACARETGDGEEVRDFMDDTSSEPHRFVYTETSPTGRITTVKGVVEDDFRYQALLSIDDSPVLERVVVDDDVAVRFFDPTQIGRFVDKDVARVVELETSLEGINVFQALEARRWVVDPGGAPPLLVAAEDRTEEGLDPIEDARRFLTRARNATFVEGAFIEYSPNDISPTYRRDEDPFPAPEEGSSVTRYDLIQPQLPRSIDPGQPFVPGDDFFRKLSVYVRDGRVIRVSEDVGLAPTVLDRFENFMTALVNETAPPEIRAGFLQQVAELEGQELGLFLLSGLNTIRSLTGDPPVRFRTATYELLDLGDPTLAVERPTDDPIEADLAVLYSLGVKPDLDPDDVDDEEGNELVALILGDDQTVTGGDEDPADDEGDGAGGSDAGTDDPGAADGSGVPSTEPAPSEAP